MKKTLIIFPAILLILLINSIVTYSATSITYYYGETIKVEDNNIEIVSDEITINTKTSKVENIVLLKNTSDEEITTSIKIPLENRELSTLINNLIIKINGIKVNYINNNGEYIVKTKIASNSSKKIEISYNTDNDLQNAKIIKCNFENFNNKTIGKLRVNIVIDEKNIPLIKKIYPGHYIFENNTISVEYYKYKVNTITKEVIIQKETFNNLLYGRETELSERQTKIISDWMEDKNVNYTKEEYIEETDETCKSILEYIEIKKGETFSLYNEPKNPLLYEMSVENMSNDITELKGKIICVDFVETEDDKKLYIYKTVGYEDVSIQEEGGIYECRQSIKEYVLMPERDILKTKIEQMRYTGKRGAKIIYVGEGINGEDLNATEEEIVQYVNSINADMYLRIEIYDNLIKHKEQTVEQSMQLTRIGKGIVGYYNDNNYEIAKGFALCNDDKIKSEEIYYRGYSDEYSLYYSNYEEYSNNYYNDYYKETLKKLSNEYVANNSEVPTIVQFIGNRVDEKGKYVIRFFEFTGFYDGFERGLITANTAIQTSQAQKLITANKEKNKNIKADIENKIVNLEILNNESVIQEEIQKETQEKNVKGIDSNVQKQQLSLNKKDLIVFVSIGIAVITCIIILIIEHKKKKR